MQHWCWEVSDRVMKSLCKVSGVYTAADKSTGTVCVQTSVCIIDIKVEL
jgi:hypothetical protein